MFYNITCITRKDLKHNSPDLGEKLGNFGLGLLQLSFGETVEVSYLGHLAKHEAYYKGQVYLVSVRIIAFILFAISSPLSVPLSVVGCIGYACSASRQMGLNDYLAYKKRMTELLELDFTKRQALDTLCSNLPGYDLESETIIEDVTENKLQNSMKELKRAIEEDQICADTGKIVQLKTQYLRMRDVYRSSMKSCSTPTSSVELTLTPLADLKNSFDDESIFNNIGQTLCKIPDYLYKYDHPRDSGEGASSLGLLLGRRKPDNKWADTLKFVENDILPNPISKLDPAAFLQLVVSIHNSLIGREEKIREQFSLVADPRKCELSFPSIKNYLKNMPNGEVLAKRVSRFEQKGLRWGTIEKAAPYVSSKQWQALQTAVFLPPSPDILNEKAMSFFKSALNFMNDTAYHPLQVAAFLHYGLTELHLFEDANGRLSRIITNIYLMQNGYEPFFVTNDRVYTEIFQEEPYDLHFIKFLCGAYEKMKKINEQNDEPKPEVECVQM